MPLIMAAAAMAGADLRRLLLAVAAGLAFSAACLAAALGTEGGADRAPAPGKAAVPIGLAASALAPRML